VNGQTVKVNYYKRDRYGRIVGKVLAPVCEVVRGYMNRHPTSSAASASRLSPLMLTMT
jgi:hypothetical protein